MGEIPHCCSSQQSVLVEVPRKQGNLLKFYSCSVLTFTHLCSFLFSAESLCLSLCPTLKKLKKSILVCCSSLSVPLVSATGNVTGTTIMTPHPGNLRLLRLGTVTKQLTQPWVPLMFQLSFSLRRLWMSLSRNKLKACLSSYTARICQNFNFLCLLPAL